MSGVIDIEEITVVSNGLFRVLIIKANTDDCNLSPVFSFYSSVLMNVLTPSSFTSFYFPLSTVKIGLINNTAFTGEYDIPSSRHLHLRTDASYTFETYSAFGFRFEEGPSVSDENHYIYCLGGRCRLQRSTQDAYVYHTNFANGLVHALVNLPRVTWSLGGFECGKDFQTGTCEGSMVSHSKFPRDTVTHFLG